MAVEVRVPQMGESVVEATISRWFKQEGEAVAAGDVLVELETDKVNVEVPSDQAGVLERILKREGETVGVNEPLAVVNEAGTATIAAPPPAAEAATAAPENGRAKSAVTPVAQKMAAERGIDLAKVKGSGPDGKIVKEDVEHYAEPTASPAAVKPAPVVATPPVSVAPPPAEPPRVAPAPVSAPPAVMTASEDRREERRPMSRRRQTIAQRLVEAQHTAAMLTTFNEIDMTAVMEIRKRRRDTFKEKHGVGLGFMSFFTKATMGALKAFPLLNAEIQGSEIVVKRYYDIGIAVSTEEGLVVPVLRDADHKTFADIERSIAELATRARDGKLTLPDLQGGTFTITNGGIFGSLMSTPILNAPQVGILGMHKIEERPIAIAGQVVIKPMMYVALSYDHRIVDGSEAVRFLVKIKELLEDPETLLLEG